MEVGHVIELVDSLVLGAVRLALCRCGPIDPLGHAAHRLNLA
jgi:hypothetical protein